MAEGPQLQWRGDRGSASKLRVQEVKHLHPENWEVPRNKYKHGSRFNYPLRDAVPLLLWRLQTHNLVRRHQGALDVIHTRVHVRHHRREPRAREVEVGLLDGGG